MTEIVLAPPYAREYTRAAPRQNNKNGHPLLLIEIASRAPIREPPSLPRSVIFQVADEELGLEPEEAERRVLLSENGASVPSDKRVC